MAEQVVSDLIMKFEVQPGQLVDGEVSTELKLNTGPMTSGFVRKKMFEVESFTMKTGTHGEDIDAATQRQQKAQQVQTKKINKNLRAIAQKLNVPLDELQDKTGVGYTKFLAGDNNARYPVDMRPMEFTRAIDKSSPSMLQYCINRQVFESATLIKRKAAGGVVSGEVFLRFDFTKVMLIDVSWEDGEPIKETCEFVCRAVTIHYLPQLPDGTLGAPIQAFWSAAKGYAPVSLR